MPYLIRDLDERDIAAVVAFSLRAWAPVFESFEKVLGPEIYRRVYPDWLDSQARDVEKTVREHAASTWVADVDGVPAGFATVIFDEPNSSAEIEMLAVDPARQREGIGAGLIEHSLERMRAAGVRLAGVGTGGDPGHAAARRAYEKAGFTALPTVHYYKAL